MCWSGSELCELGEGILESEASKLTDTHTHAETGGAEKNRRVNQTEPRVRLVKLKQEKTEIVRVKGNRWKGRKL